MRWGPQNACFMVACELYSFKQTRHSVPPPECRSAVAGLLCCPAAGLVGLAAVDESTTGVGAKFGRRVGNLYINKAQAPAPICGSGSVGGEGMMKVLYMCGAFGTLDNQNHRLSDRIRSEFPFRPSEHARAHSFQVHAACNFKQFRSER